MEKDVFAALFNGYVFDGEPVIYAEDLREVDGRNRLQIRSREEKSTYEVLKKERDLVREVTIGDSTLRLAILGIEHQSEIDYSMVLRTLAYDTLEYLKQEKAIEQKLLPFLGNWILHVISVYDVEHTDKYAGSLRQVFELLKYVGDGKAMFWKKHLCF